MSRAVIVVALVAFVLGLGVGVGLCAGDSALVHRKLAAQKANCAMGWELYSLERETSQQLAKQIESGK